MRRGSEPLKKVSEMQLCFICGQAPVDPRNYVAVEVSAWGGRGEARQLFGAHVDHLNAVLCSGFSVDVDLVLDQLGPQR